jgi:hypothetical protein
VHRMPWLVVALLVACVPPLAAQVPPPSSPATPVTPPPPPRPTIRLYVDCTTYYCDSDFIRTELPFVDHVRNPQDADVHVLATSRSTGSGGKEVTLKFTGQGPFRGVDDEIVFTTGQNDSEDTQRRSFVQTLKLGLARYAARTALGQRLVLTELKTPTGSQTAGPRSGKDPWDYWFFRVSMSMNFQGEAASTYRYLYGSTSANRTTEAWKLNFSASASHNETQYTFSDGSKYTSVRRSYGSSALVVKSLSDHWSAGAKASVNSQSYYNQDLAVAASPVIEYDFFPYSQSTRRRFTVQYALGYSYFDYKEVTLFGESREGLARHSLQVVADAKQKWGSLLGGVMASQYLSKPSKYNVELDGEASLKLLKGLSFSLGGYLEWIRDQIYLPRGAASNEEVLVRQRQLATSYSYYVYASISYSFGSIFNNIVNPRMSGF